MQNEEAREEEAFEKRKKKTVSHCHKKSWRLNSRHDSNDQGKIVECGMFT